MKLFHSYYQTDHDEYIWTEVVQGIKVQKIGFYLEKMRGSETLGEG